MARSEVPWTTVRRSSARVSCSRSKPSSRLHSPTYIAGAYWAWIPRDPLERLRQREAAALEQQLAREQRAVELGAR